MDMRFTSYSWDKSLGVYKSIFGDIFLPEWTQTSKMSFMAYHSTSNYWGGIKMHTSSIALFILSKIGMLYQITEFVKTGKIMDKTKYAFYWNAFLYPALKVLYLYTTRPHYSMIHSNYVYIEDTAIAKVYLIICWTYTYILFSSVSIGSSSI